MTPHPVIVLFMLTPLGAFAMVVYIVWVNARQKQSRIQARVEFNKQLLDKFASSQELVAFLGQEGSERFLDEMWSEKRLGPKERILRIIIPGCILTSIGIGFLWLSTQIPELQIAGVTIFAAGIGVLIAAAVSYGFSKAWGLMNGKDRSGGRRE
ncbi:MAG: hypothetical protein OXB98_19650 [Bryobacterales bacterium]|nr:hypothetical protein [Bryobacterales bacterium]